MAEEIYCIPLSYIAETIKVSAQEIKTIEQNRIIAYRDTVLSLIRLGDKCDFLPSPPRRDAQEIASRIHTIPVVVLGEGAKKVGLIVDSFLGQQEAVIKPLTGILKRIRGVSGATILGTGKVAPILDIPSLL
jgi:two-component system chemotaxis sensor kinase CheA